MLRAIGTLANCAGLFSSPDTQQDYLEMKTKYGAWSRRVEDDGWAIATYDKAGNLTYHRILGPAANRRFEVAPPAARPGPRPGCRQGH
jgi:hypothetical protein